MLRFIPRIVATVRCPSKARLFRSGLVRHLHSEGNPLLIETYDKLKVISTKDFGNIGLLQGFWYPETDPTKTGAIRLRSNNLTDTLALLKDQFLVIDKSKYADVDASTKQLRLLIKKDIPHNPQKKNELKKVENDALNRLLVRYDLSGHNLSFYATGDADLTNTIDPFIQTTVQFAKSNQIDIQSVAIGYLHFIGLQNARKIQKEGVLIKVLNSRIYPLYSVFRPPAYQEYLDLFTRMFDKHQLYNTTGKVLEIGSGTGVLSLIMTQQVLNKRPDFANQWKVVCTDINPQAVICTEMNASAVLGANKDMIEVIHADLFPPGNEKYELIVSNPPFKPVDVIRTPFELSVYDKNERFLKTLLQTVTDRLTDTGKLLLLYSNIARPVDYIDGLCKEYNLTVQVKEELDVHAKKSADPLGSAKVQGTKERLQIFIITRDNK
jgi:tRNA1(Val) A37 N6-methylase TrmN6